MNGPSQAGVLYEGYSMDFTSRIHYAVRDDGQWFKRTQYKSWRYGYKWTPWQKTLEPERAAYIQGVKPRLPKG